MWYLVGIHPSLRSVRPPPSVPRQNDLNGQQPRLHHLDSLRAFLTILVIFQHSAIIYGAAGDWSYVEATKLNPVLTVFSAVNHTWFMGCFFLISGFFSAKSLSMTISKGRTRRSAILQHLRGRLVRLGLPAAFFTLVMYPATLAIGIGKPITVDAYLTFLKGLRGVRGGAWWLSTALLFDTIFATYNGLGLPAIPVSRYLPPLTLAALPLMAWLWSSAFPFGTHIDPIHVHAPCLPQYLVAYFTGTWLSSNPQFIASRMLPKEARWRNSPLPALVLWLAYGVLLFKLPLTRSLLRDTTPLFVGGNLTSLLFGIWTELGFATLSHCAIRVAELVTRDRRRTVAKQSILPRLAYGAFLVHAILLCGIAVNLRSLRLSPVAKTLLVGSLATVASFAVSAVLTRFPGLRNII